MRAGGLCELRGRLVRRSPPQGLRRAAGQSRNGTAARRHPGSRDAWMAAHPPGFVEYLDAMGPRGPLRQVAARAQGGGAGRHDRVHARGHRPDVARHPRRREPRRRARDQGVGRRQRRAGARAPDHAVLHAEGNRRRRRRRPAAHLRGDRGRHVRWTSRVTREYVDQLRGIIGLGESPLLAAAGPMWFRGLSESPTEETERPGHRALQPARRSRGWWSVTRRGCPAGSRRASTTASIPIDTGMLATFFKGGRASALEIVGDRVTAIYASEREVLVERVGRDARGGKEGPALTGRSPYARVASWRRLPTASSSATPA